MPLRVSSNHWQYRFKVKGVRYEKVTGWEATEENRKRAETEMRRHRDAILRGDLPATARTMGRKFSELSAEFMNSLATSNIKPSSVQRLEVSMSSLRVWFAHVHLGKLDAFQVERYKAWRLTGDQDIQPVRPVTVRHDLAALSKFFAWAIRQKLVTANPVREVEKPAGEEVRMHILTEAEEMDFFDRCQRRGYRNLADIGRLMLEQGMRPEEARRLEKSSVDLERGTFRILQGKTKAARRTLRMTAAAKEILARRLWQSPSERWLFPTSKPKQRGDVPLSKLVGTFEKVAAEWSNPARPRLDFVLYDFRHTYATRMAERGMPPTTLAAVLGHSSLQMITRYVHPTQNHMDAEILRIERLMVEERKRTGSRKGRAA